MQDTFKQFTVGANVFCDLPFGGKPKGKVIEIVTPGNGKTSNGEVRVELSETVGAYRKGEIVRVGTYYAVPCCMEKPASGFFRRVSTLYAFS